TSVMVPVGQSATATITEVATLPDGVSDVQWLGDDRLVLLAPARPADQEGVDDAELARRPRILTRTDYRFNGRGWINDRPGQVFVLDLAAEGSDRRAIGLDGVDQHTMAVSPDGDFVAVTATGDDNGGNEVWLLSTAPNGPDSGQRVEPVLLTEPDGFWAALAWHPDGTLVATGMAGRGVGYLRPHRLALPAGVGGRVGGGSPSPVPSVTPLGDIDQNIGFGPGARWSVAVDGGFLFAGLRRGRIAVDHHGLDGSHQVVHEGPHQVLAFDANADRSVVVGAVTSPTRPAELWRLDGEPRRLIGLNDELLATLDLAEVEEVTVTSADGTEVHAFMTRPPASAPDTTTPGGRPGLLYIHGGPMFQYGLNFFDEFQMAAACGYVVIGGNPRGSDGYGEAWAQAITGDLGNLDWMDVTALADHLAADADVDGDRLGIGGGSYGGF
ncbi:MAG: prolyl oligopeptidase family serine peptidase, partial [Actinomycetota bacterium]